jgi:hypothetical protein
MVYFQRHIQSFNTLSPKTTQNRIRICQIGLAAAETIFSFFFSLCDKRSLDLENELFWTPINFVPLLIDTTHQIDQFSIETNYPPFFLPPFWTLRPFFLDLPPSRTFFLPTSPASPSHISRCILKPISIFNNITIEYRHSYSLLLSDAESRFLDPCWPLKN